MSYYLSAREEIIIQNNNEDTRAFTVSVKKYIQDLLQGMRIESFYAFSMELTVDEKVIVGTYVQEAYQKGFIKLESVQFDEEGMDKLINNLDFHENIRLKLSYSGFFFYFYHYSINRFSELLDEKLQGFVTYFATQEEEDALSAYQFNEVNGKLIKGYLKNQPFEKYRYIKEWKIVRFHLYMEVEDDMIWETYNIAFKEAQELADRLGLELEFDPYPPDDVDAPTTSPGALLLDRPTIKGQYVYKETLSDAELEEYYVGLCRVYEILRDYVKMINDEWQLVPANTKDGNVTVVLKIDEQKELVLSVFDPYAEGVEIIPEESVTSTVKSMEEFMSSWEDVQIPFDEDQIN